jgi:hypothetical protein
LNKEILEEMIQEYKILPKISKALGLAENTVRKYAKLWGIGFKQGRPVGHHRHYGGLIKWVREHRGVALPCSAKGIHELTGCSEDSIKSYLRRKRSALKKYLKTLPDLKQSALRFKTANGVFVPFRVVKHYTISFHPWSFIVTMVCVAGGKTFRKQFTLERFKRFIKEGAPHPSPGE